MERRPFRRSLLGYERHDVERAVGAWARSLEHAQTALKAREQDLLAQRRQIEHLNQVADRLAEMVADRNRELRFVAVELAEARTRAPANGHAGDAEATVTDLRGAQRRISPLHRAG
jgi:chromosome segregation ATPase